MKNDPYVIGMTLFEIGNPGRWGSYDVEDIAPWLAAYLQNRVIVPPAPTDLSCSAGPGTVLLRWQGGYGSTGYNVRRATSPNGPYTLLGNFGSSNSPTWTDTGVANGLTYCYIVSGTNAAGESGLSNQASATPFDGYAVNCGGLAIGRFGVDGYYSGGHTWTSTASIDTSGVPNAGPPDMYKSERAGNSLSPDFSYTFKDLRPNGSYTIRLHFAEVYFSSSGARRFNVLVNGVTVLSGFDIYGEAGKNRALVKNISAAADSSGRIVVLFQRGASN